MGQKTTWRCLIILTLWSNVCFCVSFEERLIRHHLLTLKSLYCLSRMIPLWETRKVYCNIKTTLSPFLLGETQYNLFLESLKSKLYLFAVTRRPNYSLNDSYRKRASVFIRFEVSIYSRFHWWEQCFLSKQFALKIFSIVEPNRSKVFTLNAAVWKEPEGNLQHKGTSLCEWKTIKVVLAVKKLINAVVMVTRKTAFSHAKRFWLMTTNWILQY